MSTRLIRNIGIIAHIDAGKTTTAERILFYSGETHKMGEVHDGNTVTDHMDQERERGITITAAAVSCAWTPHQGIYAGERHAINLIDTPGHVDFTAEVERSLRVLDGTVAVFCAVAGVQPQSETVWRQANKYKVPRIAFINKMDRIGANFSQVVEQIQTRLCANAHPLYLPMGKEETFVGLIDVVTQKSTRFENVASDPRGLAPSWEDIPETLRADAARAREKLIEGLAEVDTALAELYINNRAIGPAEIQGAIRRATLSRSFVGIIPGSAFRQKGVQRLLDAVVDYLPNPRESRAVAFDDQHDTHLLQADAHAPLMALGFKLTSTPNGQLVFTRIYQGTLRPGLIVYNPRTRRHERITRLVRLRATVQENLAQADAGDICAVLGLKDVVTGDTLSADLDLFLERPTFPEPVVSLAIEPCSHEDQQHLSLALQRLVAEDPTLRCTTDSDTGQTLLSGMGELHLEIIRDRMTREFQVCTTAGKPNVAFRETISRPAQAGGEYKHQSGGSGHYGHVVVILEPNSGRGIEVVNEIVGGAIPKEFIRPTLQGIQEALQDGVLLHRPVTDVRCRIIDGSAHTVDSSELAFRTAARMAFKNAMREAAPLLLEPIMAVDAITPIEYQGEILGDISRRRGNIQNVLNDGLTCTITAQVPLQNLFGYAMDLRSLSKGRADHTMTPSHYALLPRHLASAMALVSV